MRVSSMKAAHVKESRTRGSRLRPRTGNPGMGLLESSMGAMQATRASQTPEKCKRLQETHHVPKN
jgi:hypothetical protein